MNSQEASSQQPAKSQLEKLINDRLPEGTELSPHDFKTLLLDDLPIGELSAEDRAYLESFTACEHLSLRSCGLRSLANFPLMPRLLRLDLASNCLFSRKDVLAVLPQ